ncbi:hypothetical protein BGX21_001423 [Mortierella sp. AD011]|nr:hypothetical protein BGX21_001423 [Mortierella sp. AD011]
MEFTFTATPSTVATAAEEQSRIQLEGNKFGHSNAGPNPRNIPAPSVARQAATTAGVLDPQYDRVSLKREHGVGNTTQWRKRLITQIEDRIKDRRISIHNARRIGLQQYPSDAQTVDSRTGGLASIAPSTIQPQLAADESISKESANSEEEEERRIVAEVWETFKNENFEALAQAFQGMTDKEIEEIELDILKYNYTADYDPTYDLAMDMEMSDMEQTIGHYMRLETSYAAVPQEDSELASAMSLSMTIISSGPCPRCQQRALVFEPVTSPSQSGGVRASCGCGFDLEKEGLHYIATTARNHR